ncbi:hypothetical protein [Neptuniibacter caesariensis]|uniref:Uncharacterized protein n=1 Tax=Neptuniibacter caesariensis TaxID=207954 RepID=A0A7U8GRQ9_NEPCE|nr:hypothetical protein [Neptuniibacter caesariensis]EAR60457.1 hypothetical protein MED92_09011 [Oceanospirillum sp. MED92] [Neptuniibacter caesariensis]
MLLVKDFNESGFIYYWVDENQDQVSPYIPTFKLAEEWRTRYLFDQYEGNERRLSLIDRRKDESTRKEFDRSLDIVRTNPQGRREADEPVKVDIDLSVEKLKIYYS